MGRYLRWKWMSCSRRFDEGDPLGILDETGLSDRHRWNILEYPGISWNILELFRILDERKKSEVYSQFWMFLDVFGCFWMFLDVFGCFWMFLDVFGCFL